MAKVSGNYEVLYILNPTLGEEDTAALVARFKELAEGRGSVTEVVAGSDNLVDSHSEGDGQGC